MQFGGERCTENNKQESRRLDKLRLCQDYNDRTVLFTSRLYVHTYKHMFAHMFISINRS